MVLFGEGCRTNRLLASHGEVTDWVKVPADCSRSPGMWVPSAESELTPPQVLVNAEWIEGDRAGVCEESGECQ